VEIAGGVVAKELEGVDVAVAPEAALDDVMVALHSLKERLLELGVEATASAANRNVTSDVDVFASLLCGSQLGTQPSHLASRILMVNTLLVAHIVENSVQNDQTQVLVHLDRIITALLEGGKGGLGKEGLPEIRHGVVHPVAGSRQLMLRISVVVANDRIDGNLAAKVIVQLGEKVGEVLQIVLDDVLGILATALGNTVSSPQDEERVAGGALIGTHGRDLGHGSVLHRIRRTALIIAKSASGALALEASLGRIRAFLIITLHVSIRKVPEIAQLSGAETAKHASNNRNVEKMHIYD